ncbi:hypothetical protein [Nonomuraea sp. NPDC050202]|uniref:hypothetical protein n=1 Tax=Nonomuraea sp. NPDC050202 TaxID=3155035 RepID=UPI0033DACF8B
MTVTIAEEPWDSADGVRLRRAMQVELAARYNLPDQETEPPTAEPISPTRGFVPRASHRKCPLW